MQSYIPIPGHFLAAGETCKTIFRLRPLPAIFWQQARHAKQYSDIGYSRPLPDSRRDMRSYIPTPGHFLAAGETCKARFRQRPTPGFTGREPSTALDSQQKGGLNFCVRGTPLRVHGAEHFICAGRTRMYHLYRFVPACTKTRCESAVLNGGTSHHSSWHSTRS